MTAPEFNISGVTEAVTYINTSTHSLGWSIITAGLLIIIFLLLMIKESMPRSAFGASVVAFIFSVFLLSKELVSLNLVILYMVLSGITLWMAKNSG